MGMTDKQFDAYSREQLRNLLRIQKELAEINVVNEELNGMIRDLQDQLSRP